MSSILFLFLFPSNDYLQTARFSEAVRYCRLASRIEPTPQNYLEAGICELIDGRPEDAIRLLQSRVVSQTEAGFYLGIAYYRLGIYDRAIDYFTLSRIAIKEAKKKSESIDFYLGLINLKQKRFSLAKQYFVNRIDTEGTLGPLEYLDAYEQLALARQKIIEGKYPEAIEIYKNTWNFTGFRELGLAIGYEKTGEYQRSVELLNTVLNSTTDKQLILSSLYELGKIYIALKDYTDAKNYLKQYLAAESDNDAKFLFGLCLSMDVKYDSAAIFFRELPETVDDYLFYKGRTDYFRGQWGSAEEKLLRHREFFPKSQYGDRSVFILGTINYKRNEFQSSIDFYIDLINLYPTSTYAASAMKGIADAYFNLKEYQKALDTYRKVKEYQPSIKISAETRLNIYETLYHLKRYSTLIDALRRFVEENADSAVTAGLIPAVRLRIAKILADEKEYYRSLVELDNLMVHYPESPVVNEALVERARVAKNIGNETEIKKSYAGILQRKDNREYYSYAVSELASIYVKETKYDSALYYYNMLLGDEKSREMAMFEIAKIYDIIGQYSEAETMVDKLIAEFPNSIFLFDTYLLKSKSYRRRGSYDKAIEILNKLMEVTGTKPEIHIEIGDIYFEIQNYLKARDSYLLACDLFKQDRDSAARALLRAGDAAKAMNDKKNARIYYLRANLIAQSITLKNQTSAKLTEMSEE